jgi:CRP-like cAMP-binding protein
MARTAKRGSAGGTQLEGGALTMPTESNDPPSGTRPPESHAVSASLALTGNQLLVGLPRAEAEGLLVGAERVRPRMRQELHAQGGPMEHVYFPEGGVFSLLIEVAEGGIVEILTVGNEGLVGLPAVMGAIRSPSRAICQIAGWALRVPTAQLIASAPPGGVLYGRLMRYAQAQMTSLARSVACNRLHTALQRYARWVLVTQDRVGSDEFPITQEFLAQMLGVTRPTVSQVGQELQGAGIIHYAQGRLTVDDRAALERVSCECYAAVRAAFGELLGEPRG